MSGRKTMLVLGSDFGTLDLVLKAKERGHHVIVADLMEESPTKFAADEVWLVSTTDLDELEKRCRVASVNAVTFGASDFNIGNGRELCKRLGLPFYCESDRAWRVSRNKAEFKRVCRLVGARVAQGYHLDDALLPSDLEAVNYPVVVKPVDKSGNRGMSYCSNEEELRRAWAYARSVSDNEDIIVERELHGPEFAVNYAIAGGEPRILYFSSEHNQPGRPSNMYSVINTTAAHLGQYLAEMDAPVCRVFKEIGCTEGVAWVEAMLDEDGHFYLLEMGYRFGGEMTYVPYKDVSGFDTIGWMLDCAFGIGHVSDDLPVLPDSASRAVAASYHLFADRSALVSSIEGIEDLARRDGFWVDMPKRSGTWAREGSCLGVVRIFGDDCDDLCRKIQRVNESLKVLDENGSEITVRFDDFAALKHEALLSTSEAI